MAFAVELKRRERSKNSTVNLSKLPAVEGF